MTEIEIYEGTMGSIAKDFFDLVDDDEEEAHDVCLISHESLNENAIRLPCSHSFNYESIFMEICNQKMKSSKYNRRRLLIYQMQCPYCRTVHNKILPHYDSVEKVYGVNYPERYTLKNDNCSYLFKSGKKKNKQCLRACNGEYCKIHFNYVKRLVKKQEVNDIYCHEIIKSGINKGKQCSCKAVENHMCKRHLGYHKKKNP